MVGESDLFGHFSIIVHATVVVFIVRQIIYNMSNAPIVGNVKPQKPSVCIHKLFICILTYILGIR